MGMCMCMSVCVHAHVCVCVCVCGIVSLTKCVWHMCGTLVGTITTSSVDLFRSGQGLCLHCDCHTLRTLWQAERRLGLLCSS